MTGQTTLDGFEFETATDAVYCDECSEAIDGTALVVIRGSDDAVRTLCPGHIGVANIVSYTEAEEAS